MKFSAWFVSVILVVLASLTGCGGGGGGSHSPAVQANGQAALTIQWPLPPVPATGSAQPRLIPAASNSIVVTISNGATVLQSFTFVRPALAPTGYPAQTHQFTSLPVQTLTVTATAYPTTDGHGVAQASAAQPLVLTADKPASDIALTLLSTITRLTLQPGGSLSLLTGQSQQLFAVPTDATGATVLTAPSTLTWSSTDAAGQYLTVDGATGLLKAVKATLVAVPITVTATYTDKDVPAPLTASATVTVAPLPTGGPPNVSAYVNRNGLAIGPTGSGPGKFTTIADVALGSLYTADADNRGAEVQKFKQNPDGSLAPDTTFNTTGAVSVTGAASVAVDPVDPVDDSVYVLGNVTDPSTFVVTSTLYKYNPDGIGGVFVANITPSTSLATDPAGNLFVAENTGNGAQVEVYSRTGTLLTTINSLPGLLAGAPTGITVDPSDNIYVLVANAVVKLKPAAPGTPAGYTQDAAFGTGGVTTALASAADVAVDTRPGLNTTGNLYVTVPTSNVIEVFAANGTDSGSLPLTQSADVKVGGLGGITIDNRVNVPTSGYIYVANAAPAGTNSLNTGRVQVLSPGP